MKQTVIRIISLLMCILMLVPSLTFCKKKEHDDRLDNPEYTKGKDIMLEYTYEYDDSNMEYIINSGNKKDYSKVGLPLSPAQKRGNAKYSMLWKNHVARNYVTLFEGKLDLTDYTTIGIWIYNGKESGEELQLNVYCQKSGSKISYGGYKFKLDFEGWKRIEVPRTSLSNGYNPDYSKVSSIVLNASGWGMTPSEKTEIFIDSLELLPNRTFKPINFNPDDIGDYNFDHIKEGYIDFLTGGISLKDAKGEVKEKLEGYIATAESVRKTMIRRKSTPFDYDMSSTAGITSNYNQIERMARGYAIEGGKLYKDKKLLDDILYAMDYMHENYYKDKSMKQYPTRNNWWDWEIGSSQSIVNVLLLIGNDIDRKTIDKYLEPVNKYCPEPIYTMANRVDIAYVTVASAALQKSIERLLISRDALDECCIYVEKGDGFYKDGSFIQHTNIPYTGSYGPIMLEALSKIIYSCADTCFRFGDYIINSQCDWVLKSFTPLMFHGAFFGLVRGRSITRGSTDVSLGCSAVKGMVRMTKYVNDTSKLNEIKSILKEYYKYNGNYYRGALSPVDLALYDEVLEDNSVQERTNYTFAHVFAKMDRPIVHTSKYSVGISLSSSRIAKYESFHNENTKGWYTGDGMLYVYTTVDDYSPDFWHNVNPKRLPGTTVTSAERTFPEKVNSTLPNRQFVGGTSLGNYVVAAMDFESKAVGFNSTLEGHKGWFIFDDEIVCLGSAINCSDSYNTLTVIENRRIDSGTIFTSDGEEVKGNTGSVKGKSSFYLQNFGCVYLPDANQNVIFNKTQNKVSFLELYIDHGKNLNNASYSYVLLPTADEQTGLDYAKNPDIEILVNNEKVMAVKDKSSGVTGYIFWQAGEFNGVKASLPCTLMVSDSKVACADPTQKISLINITISGKTYKFDGLKDGATITLDK